MCKDVKGVAVKTEPAGCAGPLNRRHCIDGPVSTPVAYRGPGCVPFCTLDSRRWPLQAFPHQMRQDSACQLEQPAEQKSSFGLCERDCFIHTWLGPTSCKVILLISTSTGPPDCTQYSSLALTYAARNARQEVAKEGTLMGPWCTCATHNCRQRPHGRGQLIEVGTICKAKPTATQQTQHASPHCSNSSGSSAHEVPILLRRDSYTL